MSARLVVSLCGIEYPALDRCAAFAAELDRRGVPLSLLLDPRPVRVRSLGPVAPVPNWVRQRVGAGDAIALHGFDHADRYAAEADTGAPALTRIRHRAELTTLPAHEAGLRLVAALAAMERIGMRPDTFLPARWSVSAGTVTALRESGFAVCADSARVRELDTGRVHRTRLHALDGQRAEAWRARVLMSGVGRTARLGGIVRLAVDAAELHRTDRTAVLLDAVDLALGHGARPTTYRELAHPRKPYVRPRAPRPGHGVNPDPLTS